MKKIEQDSFKADDENEDWDGENKPLQKEGGATICVESHETTRKENTRMEIDTLEATGNIVFRQGDENVKIVEDV